MPGPDWQSLFQLGVAVRELAPWTWMSDSEVFGVRVPGADRIGWCVVLGAAGELEGLCVYMGDSGFDVYRAIQDEQAAVEEFWGQDALVLLFGDRDEVSPKQRVLYKEHGFKFRGRGAWPAFTEHRVGYLPRDIQPAQVPFLTQCLKDCLRLAATLRTDPGYLDGERLLVISGEEVEWVPEPAPPPEPAAPLPDQLALGRVRARCKRADFILEVAVFPFVMASLDSPDGPIVPAAALVVDSRSGMILGHELDGSLQREELAQRALIIGIEQAGSIPRSVRVADPGTARSIAPVAEGLDIGLELAEDLPMLDEARVGMMGFFEGGIPG